MASFGQPLTFRALLEGLERHCECTVTLQDAGGIPDPLGGVTGALYYVERSTKGRLHFAFVEVFHMDVVVLPVLLRSICQQLAVSESDLRRHLQ